jgi:hypothetical protein
MVGLNFTMFLFCTLETKGKLQVNDTHKDYGHIPAGVPDRMTFD